MSTTLQQTIHTFGYPFKQKQINSLMKQMKSIKQIDCGYDHIIILDDKNNIYGCGTNVSGQLGLGDEIKGVDYFIQVNEFLLNGRIKYIATGLKFTIVLTLQNEILGTGRTNIIDDCKSFEKIQQFNNDFIVKKIKCGGSNSIILNNQNELFIAGNNYANQLGFQDLNKKFIKFEKKILPHEIKEIKDIGCGHCYSIILTNNNYVYISGFYKYTEFTKLNSIKYSQISCLFNDFSLLSLDNKQLYKYKTDSTYYSNNNERIKKIYSGFGEFTYYLNNSVIGNEIKKAVTKEKSVTLLMDWKLPYLSLVTGSNFVIVLNSNYDIDKGETNEVIRMIDLLFNLFYNSIFTDIDIS